MTGWLSARFALVSCCFIWGFAAATQAGAQSQPNESAAPPAYGTAVHDQLISDWRARRADAHTVLAQLQLWLSQATPASERARLASDIVTIAWQAGRPRQAVDAARGLGVQALAPYALAPLAAAARAEGDTALQGQAVQQQVRLRPLAFDTRVQEALWFIDSGAEDAARRAISTLAARAATPAEQVAVLELRAIHAEARGDLAGARGHYDALLRVDPGYRPALRSRLFLSARMGAPGTALAEAQSQPGLLSPPERASLEQQALAQRLRWAIAERDQGGDDPRRFSALDAVLRDGEVLARQFGDAEGASADPAWQAARRRLDADRVVALFERGGRDAQAVALHDALRAEGGAPWHATAAAAGAHARLGQAERAVPLYEAALRDAGQALRMPSDVHVGLVYAYLDTGRFAQADALVARMIDRTPPLLADSPEAGRPNDEYGDLLGLRARVLLYSDRPAQAQREFAQLAALAPRSETYRAGQARLLRAREQPQAALRLLDDVLVDHPLSVDARAARAETLYDTGRLHEATRRVDELAQAHPDHGAVRGARRARDTVMAPRLDIDAGRGRDGGTLTHRDGHVQARLSSGWVTRPDEHNWRVFAHQQRGGADIAGARVDAVRTGLGLQWRHGPLDAEAQAHHTRDAGGGLALSAGWRATDHWRLSAALDTRAWDIPWRARQAGASGRDAALAMAWVASESRRVDARLTRLRMSDGNGRNGASLAWRERWLSSPRWQLSTTLAADTARHGRQNVPYFSPAREDALALTGRARWLSFKQGDRVMYQVLEAGAGRYRQVGFGGGATRTLRYAHEWHWGAGWLLHYGLGAGLHPYDGVRERRRDVFVHLSMPLH